MGGRRMVGAAFVLLLAACSSPSRPVDPGAKCSDYGGCDVLLDLTDGSTSLLPLKTMSLADATARALKESKRDDVVDAGVVGDAPPHVGVGGLYHH